MADENGEEPRSCSIWPLFWFEPKWRCPWYRFPPWVTLRKPGSDAVKSMLEALKCWCEIRRDMQDSLGREYFDTVYSYWDCPIWDESPLINAEEELQWFLCVQVEGLTQERPAQEIGVDFRRELEEDIVHTFLASLRLLQKKPVFAPVGLTAPVKQREPDFNNLTFDGEFWKLHVDDPDRLPSSELEEKDAKRLESIWKRLAKLRKLDSWKKYVASDEFFFRLDKDAERLTRVGHLDSLSEYLDEQYGLRLPLRHLEKIVKHLQDRENKPLLSPSEGRDEEPERYYRLFIRRFKEIQEERTYSVSRIGRAVAVFIGALDLPRMQEFLSMCLVLEILYNTGQGNLKHSIARRASWLLKKDRTSAGEAVYGERSDLVHGEKAFREISGFTIASASNLARETILNIMSDKKRFEIFSLDKEEGEVHKFFEDLE